MLSVRVQRTMRKKRRRLEAVIHSHLIDAGYLAGLHHRPDLAGGRCYDHKTIRGGARVDPADDPNYPLRVTLYWWNARPSLTFRNTHDLCRALERNL